MRTRNDFSAITINGVTRSLDGWAESSGLSKFCIRHRHLVQGMPWEQAVSLPPARKVRRLVGLTFGRLTVLSQRIVPYHETTATEVHVQCVCGVDFRVFVKSVVDGHTRSCGCLRREVCSANSKQRAALRRAATNQQPTAAP